MRYRAEVAPKITVLSREGVAPAGRIPKPRAKSTPARRPEWGRGVVRAGRVFEEREIGRPRRKLIGNRDWR